MWGTPGNDAVCCSQLGNVVKPLINDDREPFKGFSCQGTAATGSTSQAFPGEITAFVNARIDWEKKPETHVVRVHIPNLQKREVKVRVLEGRIVEIRGERRLEKEEKVNGKQVLFEHSSGKFSRQIRLPESADLDKLQACMASGVLTFTVPNKK
ncbi:18.1 kDa class I heat shock protein-like [Malania oleifera]|uniref:18.1 kDa class I heat shock protein-like n=1 Tax=Malania oleifera TaxID=397392 RepID=UPI0025AE2E86|nr:18.1 kDa class I heat shock protein-like [Malania oleifera]